MSRRFPIIACAVLLASAAAPSHAQPAPLFEGMGSYTLRSGSPVKRVQRYFDQGIVLAWGFNPREASRSFEAAAREDLKCALCFWGLAWSLGPTINLDMAKGDFGRVQTAVGRAQALSVNAPPRDRTLIAALAARHPKAGQVDELAYAAQMREAARKFPRDADVLTLAAEALMNIRPYDWWERDGTPKPGTGDIETLLAAALKIAPDHPGANHYYIHLMEASATPELALAAAARLETAVPGSAHLLHMPAHVYMRTGRYAEAIAASERSIAADERYLAQVQARGDYLEGYAAHNHHFLWAAAAMDGRSQLALDAARGAYRTACGPRPTLRDGTFQHLFALQYYTLVRFGRWDEILKDMPPPDAHAPYALAVWYFARGMAYAKTNKPKDAKRTLAELEKTAADPALAQYKIKNINATDKLARIAVLTLQAELASADGNPAQAVKLLEEATAIEDALAYDEPHLWYAPTRQALGAMLLKAGRPADAERVYLEDLRHYPENAWSLLGLAQAVAKQGRTDEARAIDDRFAAAWKRADAKLFASVR